MSTSRPETTFLSVSETMSFIILIKYYFSTLLLKAEHRSKTRRDSTREIAHQLRGIAMKGREPGFKFPAPT